MSKDSTQRPRPDSNRGLFDPKSDAVTDWPLRLQRGLRAQARKSELKSSPGSAILLDMAHAHTRTHARTHARTHTHTHTHCNAMHLTMAMAVSRHGVHVLFHLVPHCTYAHSLSPSLPPPPLSLSLYLSLHDSHAKKENFALSDFTNFRRVNISVGSDHRASSLV